MHFFTLFFFFAEIGLDPAFPLIPNSIRLNYRDANVVQTLQTNAAFYGEAGSIGHVDICVNDGNMQPFCLDSDRNS